MVVKEGDANWENLGMKIINLSNLIYPEEINFESAYPNPFNPITKINFEVPEPTDVKIIIHDLLGRTISVLANGNFEPGRHEVKWVSQNHAAGIYFVNIQVNNLDGTRFTQTQKLMLVK